MIVTGIILGTSAVTLTACSGSSKAGAVLAPPATEHITLIGKVDADSGAPGTFTAKEEWPAFAPSTIRVKRGDTVVLTTKEYDDMMVPLGDSSPYNKPTGGTETVNGKRVTSVGNDMIAHTFTIPALGVNIPLPVASDDGPSNVVFTFKVPNRPGTYRWQCLTPCGSGPDGVGGAMQTNGWMRGTFVVA